MKRLVFIGAMVIALQLTMYQSSEAQNFSVQAFSVDATGFGFPPPDDILMPGPFPVLPGTGTFIPPPMPSPGIVDVDGFTFGRFGRAIPTTFDFSVDGFSMGVPSSAVSTEFVMGGLGEQNYDVFRSLGGVTNVQVHDGNGAGPGGTVSPLGMMEPQLPSGGVPAGLNPFDSGVDGYDNGPSPIPGSSVYWSWDPYGFPPAFSPSPADVLIGPTLPGYPGFSAIFATETMLGLSPGDNIDALEVFDFGTIGTFDPGLDMILFSLDPFSPSLGLMSAADIFVSSGGGAFGLFLPASGLGLSPGDNLTALSAVPEPGSALICLIAFGLAAAKRRRRM